MICSEVYICIIQNIFPHRFSRTCLGKQLSNTRQWKKNPLTSNLQLNRICLFAEKHVKSNQPILWEPLLNANSHSWLLNKYNYDGFIWLGEHCLLSLQEIEKSDLGDFLPSTCSLHDMVSIITDGFSNESNLNETGIFNSTHMISSTMKFSFGTGTKNPNTRIFSPPL